MNKLAIDGGTPQRRTPFAPWPVFAQDEIDAVSRVLASGQVNAWTGEACIRFERAYAAATGMRYAIALANGTLALELALIALGIGAGDEVIVPSRTFIASASCAVARGAIPVTADVDALSQTLTADTVRAVLTPRTRAIVAVHLGGWPCDMAPLLALAREHGLVVIEDCAQAHGARYHGRPVGSLGDAAAFSFCQDKIISTGGEGGMLLLNDPLHWQRAWAYKDHGKSYTTVFKRDHPSGFRWVHDSFGSNWRMTEMQAAIGRLQLVKLRDWHRQRRALAACLDHELADAPGLRLALPPPHIDHAYYRYYAFLHPEALRPDWNQLRVIAAIEAEGIPCQVGSCSELYREQAFINSGYGRTAPHPVAQQLGACSIAFPLHPGLNKSDMTDIGAAVRKVMLSAMKTSPLASKPAETHFLTKQAPGTGNKDASRVG